MCGGSQARTKAIVFNGHEMRACTDGGKVNVRTGERISCFDIYGGGVE